MAQTFKRNNYDFLSMFDAFSLSLSLYFHSNTSKMELNLQRRENLYIKIYLVIAIGIWAHG